MSDVSGKSTNLDRLRDLVEQLDKHKAYGTEYNNTVKEIERIIKDERKVICNLKRSDTKIKHYENICESILTLIGANTLV